MLSAGLAVVLAAIVVPWTEPLFGARVIDRAFDLRVIEKRALLGSARVQAVFQDDRELFPFRRIARDRGYNIGQEKPKVRGLDPTRDDAEIVVVGFEYGIFAFLFREPGSSAWTIETGETARISYAMLHSDPHSEIPMPVIPPEARQN